MSNDSKPTRYHWIITGQAGDGRVATHDGHIDIHPSHTRMATYTYLRERLQEQMGAAIAVLYFDLAPMQFPDVER